MDENEGKARESEPGGGETELIEMHAPDIMVGEGVDAWPLSNPGAEGGLCNTIQTIFLSSHME